MHSNGSLLVRVGPYASSLWVFMDPCRSLCVLMSSYESLLVFVCPFGFLWVLMHCYALLQVVMGPYRFLCVLMDSSGS